MERIAFRQEIVEIPLDLLIPSKEFTRRTFETRKYRQIVASLEHVGQIEPFAVVPALEGKSLIMNGSLRYYGLKELKKPSALCVFALDDEAYTYNKRVNPLSPITEHFMILRAIENGVSEDRSAAGLDVDVRAIRARRNLLDGICPETVDLLKDKRVGSRTFVQLRKMKPVRQIEAAELMVSGKNYSTAFATSILAVTENDLLVRPERRREAYTATTLEQANSTLTADVNRARRTFGENMLTLSVTCRSIEKLLENQKVDLYLQKYHPEVLKEMLEIIASVRSESAQPGRAKLSSPARKVG
jgi:hypothetical protein